MSATFYRHISRDQLASRVPVGVRQLAASIALLEPYTLVVFKPSPVLVGHVLRALKKVGSADGEPLILAAHDFTQEARKLALTQAAHVLEETHFGWTESSYDEIRTKIASNKKHPVSK